MCSQLKFRSSLHFLYLSHGFSGGQGPLGFCDAGGGGHGLGFGSGHGGGHGGGQQQS